ncbi:MAG: ribonuclease HII [bacterium]|nr:ribonuclease HII [bacterium]
MKIETKKSFKFGICEKFLWKKGYKKVLFIDEVGRGSVAGSLVLGGVVLDKRFNFKKENWVKLVRDSKKLTPKKREDIFKIASIHPLVHWEITKISNKIIDEINILEAFKLGVKKLLQVFNEKKKIDFLIIDGNTKFQIVLPYKSIIKADDKIFSCSLASIIAKVKRDEMMRKFHKKFPQFSFFKNKGYGTQEHFDSIKNNGFCPIHRKSFLKKLQ